MFNPKQLESVLMPHSRGTQLNVFVQPGASKSEITGLHGSNSDLRLKVRVAAPPSDGEANVELCRFFAKLFDVPKTRVVLLSGDRSRFKALLFQGTPRESLIKILVSCLHI
jgi:uncharacterized protein (TIGR00251 family)